jgi:hypothetical protein
MLKKQCSFKNQMYPRDTVSGKQRPGLLPHKNDVEVEIDHLRAQLHALRSQRIAVTQTHREVVQAIYTIDQSIEKEYEKKKALSYQIEAFTPLLELLLLKTERFVEAQARSLGVYNDPSKEDLGQSMDFDASPSVKDMRTSISPTLSPHPISTSYSNPPMVSPSSSFDMEAAISILMEAASKGADAEAHEELPIQQAPAASMAEPSLYESSEESSAAPALDQVTASPLSPALSLAPSPRRPLNAYPSSTDLTPTLDDVLPSPSSTTAPILRPVITAATATATAVTAPLPALAPSIQSPLSSPQVPSFRPPAVTTSLPFPREELTRSPVAPQLIPAPRVPLAASASAHSRKPAAKRISFSSRQWNIETTAASADSSLSASTPVASKTTQQTLPRAVAAPLHTYSARSQPILIQSRTLGSASLLAESQAAGGLSSKLLPAREQWILDEGPVASISPKTKKLRDLVKRTG